MAFFREELKTYPGNTPRLIDVSCWRRGFGGACVMFNDDPNPSHGGFKSDDFSVQNIPDCPAVRKVFVGVGKMESLLTEKSHLEKNCDSAVWCVYCSHVSLNRSPLQKYN